MESTDKEEIIFYVCYILKDYQNIKFNKTSSM